MKYGLVQREGNVNSDGAGIGGGIGVGPDGYDGHVTFYVEVPDVEAALAQAESLGGSRCSARSRDRGSGARPLRRSRGSLGLVKSVS